MAEFTWAVEFLRKENISLFYDRFDENLDVISSVTNKIWYGNWRYILYVYRNLVPVLSI